MSTCPFRGKGEIRKTYPLLRSLDLEPFGTLRVPSTGTLKASVRYAREDRSTVEEVGVGTE